MIKLAIVAAVSAAIGAGAVTVVLSAQAQSGPFHNFLVADSYLYVIEPLSGMVSLCQPSGGGMTCSDPVSIR